MADRKISDLTALTTPAAGDFLPIVDISEAAAADKNKRITIEELMRGAPDGTAAAPSIAFETDPNTGIYSPGADQLAIATGGGERLRIDSSGRLLVGTSSSISEQFSGQARIQIAGTNYYNLASFQYSNDAFENVTSFCKSRGASIGAHAVVQSNDTLSSIRAQGSDGTGFLIATAITSQADGSIVTTAGSFVVGRRYKILTVGDTNFTLIGASANTVGVIFAATGVGTGTGTATSEPYTNSMPGRLVFSTTADGAASPTERLRITNAGNVLVGASTANTSGAKLQTVDGLTFPATAVASADPNTLDDYEEGTFTPTVIGATTAGTASYATQFGNYTKIGRMVTVTIFLEWSSGTGTGTLRFAGLPFSTIATANSFYSVAIGYVNNIALTALHYITGYTITNSSVIEFAQAPVGGGGKLDLPYDSSGGLIVTCSYFAGS